MIDSVKNYSGIMRTLEDDKPLRVWNKGDIIFLTDEVIKRAYMTGTRKSPGMKLMTSYFPDITEDTPLLLLKPLSLVKRSEMYWFSDIYVLAGEHVVLFNLRSVCDPEDAIWKHKQCK
jgi:hypothetical protein